MTVSPRSEQINAVLSPHLPPPLTNIIISYNTVFDDEETMGALKHLVTNLTGMDRMLPSEDGYYLALAMLDKIYQALKKENLLHSCVANTKMTPVEQVELAKRYSILHLAVTYYKILQPVPDLDSLAIVKDKMDVWAFCQQIPEKLTWVRTNSPIKEFNENDLAQLEESSGHPRIRIVVFFDRPQVFNWIDSCRMRIVI